MSASTIYITNGAGPLAPIAAAALAGPGRRIVAACPPGGDNAAQAALEAIDGVEVVIVDCASDAGWNALAALPAAMAGKVDIIVHCPPPSSAAEDILRSAWLAAKHANSMTRSGSAILLAMLHANDTERSDVERAAAIGALQIAMPCGLLDAMKDGLALRSNRLIVYDGAQQADIAAAIALLCDERSSFITGEAIEIAARQDAPQGVGTRLDCKSVLITGATSPIGRATAIEIGRLGGWVGIGARKLDLAEDVLSAVRSAGGDGAVIPLDIRGAEGWRDAISTIVSARGAINGLVNNAGDARYGPISAMSSQDVDHVAGINYRACLTGMEQASAAIAASGGGSIVNVASVAGLRSGFENSVYGGSRGAMIAMSRSFPRRAGHPASVRVNSVQAGLIWSENVVQTLGEEGAAAFRAMIEPKTPAGRVGQPREIACPIAFLLSDAAAAITGQAITVSGGLELCYP